MPSALTVTDTHDLRHPLAVAARQRALIRQQDVQIGAVLGERGPELAEHGASQLGEIDRLVLEVDGAGVEA